MSGTFEVFLPRPVWVGGRCFCCCCVFSWVVGLGLCTAATVCDALALAFSNAASRASFALSSAFSRVSRRASRAARSSVVEGAHAATKVLVGLGVLRKEFAKSVEAPGANNVEGGVVGRSGKAMSGRRWWHIFVV